MKEEKERKKKKYRKTIDSNEMAHHVKVIVAKPNYPSSIPRTHTYSRNRKPFFIKESASSRPTASPLKVGFGEPAVSCFFKGMAECEPQHPRHPCRLST